MKKKLVAVLLGMSLMLSSAPGVGAEAMDGGFAAEFDSETEATSEAVTEAPEETAQEGSAFEDGFTSGEENDHEETNIPDIFGEGESVTDGASEAADGTEEQEKKNCWQWDRLAGAFQYYGENGEPMTMEEVEALWKSQGKYTGYYEIDNEYYCLDENGIPRTGEITLTVNGISAAYYFDPAVDSLGIFGKMFRNGWRCFNDEKGERWVCYDTGEQNPADMGKLYVHGTIATELDNLKGGDTYLIDKNGYLLKGKTMTKAADGCYYATDAAGRVYKDKIITYKNNKYYFGSDGKKVIWQNSWHRCPGARNRLYYFGKKPGRIEKKTGWQKIPRSNGKFYGWFYFNKNGDHYVDKLTSSGYYFKPDGRLASGLTVIGGKSYFFEISTSETRKGKMIKGKMFTYKKKTYYASASGVLRGSGWQKIDGDYYYFKDMVAVKDTFIKKGNTYGYLDNTGKFTTGWVVVDDSRNLVRYLNPDKKGFVQNTSKWIDGKLYYFDKDGYRINDLTSRYTSGYSLEVDRVNGVMTVYAEGGTVPVKSIRVSVGLSGTPTPTGTYRLSRGGRWQSLMGPSWGQYASHVDGAGQGGIFVHSIACSLPNSYNLPVSAYNMLGNPASHGCIRTCVADAKWVYEHCIGSQIRIFDGAYKAQESFKGPLGRRALEPLRAPKNGGYYDPTDPAVV